MSQAIKQEAKKLSELGLVCVPLTVGKKSPAVKAWETMTKTPLESFRPNTKGMGIVCGDASGVFCLDIDKVDIWEKILNALGNPKEHELTPCVQTPSGGFHFYFQHDPEITTTTNTMHIDGIEKTGVDVRAQKGQVVAPPSIYYASKPEKKQFNGKRYEWIRSFDDCKPQICPSWLKRLLLKTDKLTVDGDALRMVSQVDERPDNLEETNPLHEILAKAQKQEKEILKSLDTSVETPDTDTDEVDFDTIGEIGESGEYNESGQKRTLTLEQVARIVNGLKTERFGDYDQWCHLLWAVARWQEANEIDEDTVTDMLDSFSQKCDNYGSKSDVIKKYNEAFKGKNRAKQFTIGTVIHWLKEDNYATYCNVLGLGNLKTVEVKLIDRRDSYCWVDFVSALTEKVWESKAELDEYMKANISRVLAVVHKGKGFYIKKDACLGGLFNVVEKFGDVINFDIKFVSQKVDKRTKDKKTKDCLETMSFTKYLKETNILKNYADIGCYPDEKVKPCPPSNYNIWEGFQANTVEKVDESKIADLQYILRELWASGDEQLYKYLLGWFRFVVAHPAEMAKVALFMYSEEGAGKGTFTDFFRQYVLGNGISHVYVGINEILEKHNTNKSGKKLSIVNEMGSTREEFVSNYDKVKPLITDPIVTENPKGKTIIQVDNIMNVIMCTNHKNSLYISESDRRYTCIEVSNAKCGQEHKDWWAGVNKRIMNQEAGDHFYTWLLSLNEDDLPNPRVVYKTKLREEIISLSRDNVLVFTDWVVEQNENAEEDEKRTEVQASALYAEYCEWCKQNGERAKNNRAFGMTIKNTLTFKKTNKCYYYVLPQPETQLSK